MTNYRITDDEQAQINRLQDEIENLFMWQKMYKSGCFNCIQDTVNPAYLGYENLKLRIADLVQGKPMEDRWILSDIEKRLRLKVAEYERQAAEATN
ncbi:hypothetical protein [Mycoplana ramosa]|uniref:Uncharacterized protein n=1 Tax=Mycoplana ramosa TaxID=40837 RepID=A0ABW3YR40_MYCRA